MEKTERKTKRAYMYVVECADGTLYTGYTTDVERRIKTHNAGKGAKYTKSRLPVKLIYQESFDSKEAAMSAESYFKQKTRQQKLDYIHEHKSLTQKTHPDSSRVRLLLYFLLYVYGLTNTNFLLRLYVRCGSLLSLFW